MWIKKLFPLLMIISCALGASAQENWPSPEVEHMYGSAQEYMAMGNMAQAAIIFKQMLTFVPGNMMVTTQLGICYYRQEKYRESVEVLSPLMDSVDAEAVVYATIVENQTHLKQYKEAKNLLKRSMAKFPNSGGLFFAQGKLCMEEGNELEAVKSWCDGIEKYPGNVQNYHDAALSFMNSQNVLWGLIYGEEYLAMLHDTSGDDTFKQQLFAAWKVYFNTITEYDLGLTPTPLEQAINGIYKQLTPVVSDGITTENLTMARVRFLMQWFKQYDPVYQSPAFKDRNAKYTDNAAHEQNLPFALFRYQDKLVCTGWFDIYEEWLFGKAESKSEYGAWNKFHEGMMPSFEKWQDDTPLAPSIKGQVTRTSDANLAYLFDKKKKR